MPAKTTSPSRGARASAPPPPQRRRRSSSARSGQGIPGWAIAAGVGTLALIGFIVLVSGGETPVRAEKPREPDPVLGMSNPRTKSVSDWVRFVGEGNRFEVQLRSRLPSLQSQLASVQAPKLTALSGEEARAMEATVLDALLTGEETAVFRDFEFVRAELVDRSMEKARSGRVELRLSPRNPKIYDTAVVEVSFEWEEPLAKVTGWQVTHMPAAPPPPKPKDTHKAHDKIGPSKMSERTLGGKTFKVWEADVVPLPHLADTPPALQQEIDALIADLTNIAALPPVRSKAGRRLKEIGRPAMPRLLNKFYEIPGKTQDEVLAITQITRLLRDMTGQSFGYTPEEMSVMGKEATEEMRQSALRQWYAWWSHNHDRDFTAEIDKRENLEEELPPEKPKAPAAPRRSPQDK